MKDGTQRRCFAVDFLSSKEIEKMDEVQKLFVFGSLMEAGSDTSRVTIGQIIAGVITYPDWVQRARTELDSVCGANGERLPQWEDRDRLPYITAVVKEGLRWRPNIAEIGAPTALTKDDEYGGYRFPKGTVFTWNAWAIALSPDEYKDPERFWPDRFLDENLGNALKGHWAFGPGKPDCFHARTLTLMVVCRASSLRRLERRRDERVDCHCSIALLLRLWRSAGSAYRHDAYSSAYQKFAPICGQGHREEPGA